MKVTIDKEKIWSLEEKLEEANKELENAKDKITELNNCIRELLEDGEYILDVFERYDSFIKMTSDEWLAISDLKSRIKGEY